MTATPVLLVQADRVYKKLVASFRPPSFLPSQSHQKFTYDPSYHDQTTIQWLSDHDLLDSSLPSSPSRRHALEHRPHPHDFLSRPPLRTSPHLPHGSPLRLEQHAPCAARTRITSVSRQWAAPQRHLLHRLLRVRSFTTSRRPGIRFRSFPTSPGTPSPLRRRTRLAPLLDQPILTPTPLPSSTLVPLHTWVPMSTSEEPPLSPNATTSMPLCATPSSRPP